MKVSLENWFPTKFYLPILGRPVWCQWHPWRKKYRLVHPNSALETRNSSQGHPDRFPLYQVNLLRKVLKQLVYCNLIKNGLNAVISVLVERNHFCRLPWDPEGPIYTKILLCWTNLVTHLKMHPSCGGTSSRLPPSFVDIKWFIWKEYL